MSKSAALMTLIILVAEPSVDSFFARAAPPAVVYQNSIGALDDLITRLYSRDELVDRSRLHRDLVALANRSTEDRTRVISRLIQVLEDGRNIAEKTAYQAWYDAASVLGAMKALEAMNVLARNIDFTNGVTTFAPSNWPGMTALVQIGPPSIPKLVAALREGSGSYFQRRNAAWALALIGTRKARAGLETALRSEKNPELRAEIRRFLSAMPRK
jgi:HEAT repeat protein